MSDLAVMVTIEGEFNDWKTIKNKCTEFFSDNKGIGVGLIHRRIESKFGIFQVKFVLVFLDSALKHRIKPINRFKMVEIRNQGLETILNSLGRKLVVNLQREDPAQGITKRGLFSINYSDSIISVNNSFCLSVKLVG